MSIAEAEIIHPFALPVLPSIVSAGRTIGGFFGGGLPFGGYIVLALLVAFGGFWGYERIQIAGRDKTITELHEQIDGPTGYIAQIGRARSDVAVANANIADLTKSVASLDGQIDKLATDSAAAVKRSQALQGQLRAAETKAANVAALLNAQRPAQPSYAALTGLIKQRVTP